MILPTQKIYSEQEKYAQTFESRMEKLFLLSSGFRCSKVIENEFNDLIAEGSFLSFRLLRQTPAKDKEQQKIILDS